MIFKNKRGEVPWYVIALILAIVVLLVVLAGPVRKINKSQNDAAKSTEDTCALAIQGASCQPNPSGDGKCTAGTKMPGICPDKDGQKQVCCSAA